MKSVRNVVIRISTAALFLAALVSPLCAQAKTDWRTQYPKIIFAPSSSENEADRIVRNKPLQDYLKKTLGVDVEIFMVSDYAGQIEALKAKKIQMASLGSDAYAAAFDVTKGNVEPLVVAIDTMGSTGYNSIVIVQKDSPIKSIADLKGKSFAFADPNSTSGFLFPTFYFRKMGINPDSYFSKWGFGGSHENDVMAVVNGTYNAGATYTTNEIKGVVQGLVAKGMIKKDAVRTIWKSAIIPQRTDRRPQGLARPDEEGHPKGLLGFRRDRRPRGFQGLHRARRHQRLRGRDPRSLAGHHRNARREHQASEEIGPLPPANT